MAAIRAQAAEKQRQQQAAMTQKALERKQKAAARLKK
jgi:hypothetical protein